MVARLLAPLACCWLAFWRSPFWLATEAPSNIAMADDGTSYLWCCKCRCSSSQAFLAVRWWGHFALLRGWDEDDFHFAWGVLECGPRPFAQAPRFEWWVARGFAFFGGLPCVCLCPHSFGDQSDRNPGYSHAFLRVRGLPWAACLLLWWSLRVTTPHLWLHVLILGSLDSLDGWSKWRYVVLMKLQLPRCLMKPPIMITLWLSVLRAWSAGCVTQLACLGAFMLCQKDGHNEVVRALKPSATFVIKFKLFPSLTACWRQALLRSLQIAKKKKMIRALISVLFDIYCPLSCFSSLNRWSPFDRFTCQLLLRPMELESIFEPVMQCADQLNSSCAKRFILGESKWVGLCHHWSCFHYASSMFPIASRTSNT